MNDKEKLISLLILTDPNPYTCESESGSCELTTCTECRARSTADLLIENGVTVQEWISVDDRLPEEKVNCIVHYQHAYCDNDGYWAIGFCYYDGEKFKLDPAYKVTHWMPIPQPPKGE